MARVNIVTAIDIGTSTIKGLQVQKIANSGESKVLAIAKESSEGIRKGVVENTQQVTEKIRLVLDRLFQISQQRVGGIITNIGGSHIFVVPSRGGVVVSRADQRISHEDIERALASAQIFSLPPNKEILEAWPKEFIVDQEGGVREPLGMKGIRLEAEVLTLCGFSPYVRNVTDAVLALKVQLLDLIPSPLTSARAVLTPRQKELGCAMIDIGARTCDLAVFEEGELIHAAVLPVGSANITDDLAIAFRVDTDTAEKIKLEFGIPFAGKNIKGSHTLQVIKKAQISKGSKGGSRASFTTPKRRKSSDKRTGRVWEVEVSPGSYISFSPTILSKVIEARLRDIFEEVNKELKRIARQELLPAGVILTGGGAQLLNLVELAKRELRLPCKIGVPSKINGLPEDPSLSAACGLALEGLELNGGTTSKFTSTDFKSKIKGFFRMFIP